MNPGRLAQIACLLEVTAPKAGNVHRFRDFDDCTYLDFVLSAQAIGPSIDVAGVVGVGVGGAVLAAVGATRQVVTTNTNLGMVLLLAPLAAVPEEMPIREGIRDVLDGLTVDDARLVYRAIRLARPGGLGEVNGQDVADEPTVTLTEAMALAADRDLVARQYATGYADVFDVAVPALETAIASGRSLDVSIVAAHLHLLAETGDTLIARKLGTALSDDARRRAGDVLTLGWPDRDEGLHAFDDFDQWLRADGHARNPGATADLIAAALFVALRSGTILLPLSGRAGGVS